MAICLFFAIGFLLYANIFNNEFIWDNILEITQNVYVKNFDVGKIFTENTAAGAGRTNNFYRPISLLSFAIDYKLWGENPPGFHLTNLLIHIASTILIYFIISLLQPKKIISFLTALLFLVHPLQVESVTYISGRHDLLLVLFGLVSIYLFIKAWTGIIQWKFYYVFSLISFTLALLSKESAVAIPFILPVIIVFISEKNTLQYWRQLFLKLTPFFSILSVYIISRLTILKFGEPFSSAAIPLKLRFLMFVKGLMADWQIFFVPRNLHFRMDQTITYSKFDPQIIISLILLFAIVWLCVASLKKNKILFFGFGWFFIALAPVSNTIVPVGFFLGERWLRLPSIGLFFLLATAISFIYSHLKTKNFLNLIFLIIFVAFISTLSFITINTNRLWKNSISYFSYLVRFYPDDFGNRLNLAIAYAQAGKNEKALEEYKTIIGSLEIYLKNEQIKKSLSQLILAHKTLASLYVEFKKYNDALIQLEELQKLVPDDWKPYSLLAKVYILKGDYGQAEELFEKVLSIDPDNARAKNYLELLRDGQVPKI